MLRTQINNTFDNPNINRSNVISFLDFKHRKEHQGLNDINEYLRKAEVLDRLLKYEEAIAAYDKAIELDPQCAEAYLGKWYILDELERVEEALEIYSKISNLKVTHTNNYIYEKSAYNLLDLKRYEEAIVACNKAIELEPDYVGAYHQRSLYLSLRKIKRIDSVALYN